MRSKNVVCDGKVTIEVVDKFGDHQTEEFRENTLSAFKMDVPHTATLHFPQVLIDKMRKVKEVANEMHLSNVEFGISLKDSVERPQIEVFDKDGNLIPITEYEECGTFKTLDEFSVTYSWFYQGFQGRFYYATGWCEESFKTQWFDL